MNYLTLGIHYPKSGHTEDLLHATKKIAEVARETQGFVEYDIGPGTLAIGVGAPEWKPPRGGGCAALEVDDFDEAMSRLRERGCTFTLERMETPVCHMAVVSDPDGNSVMIHRRKAG